MAVYQNILQHAGNTPLVRLNRLPGEGAATVYLKVEAFNPGGSIKVRPALAMIEDAERRGLLGPGSIIVEPTSGNQGIALAMIGAVKGYRVIICMPETMSLERRKLLRAYGAEVELTPAGKDIKETIENCVARVMEMKASDPRVFVPQQFENPANCLSHARGTAMEIWNDLGPAVDVLVAGIGTGGTITGAGRRLKELKPGIRVVAVEPANAPLLGEGPVGHHIQEGIGDGIMPGILDPTVVDLVLSVTDEEAVEASRLLARREGILVGVSSGTTVAGALRLARQLGPGATIVAIAADGADRYLSTKLLEPPGSPVI
ncbi:MAG: cysteine synthase A [Bacillota bacterium]